MNRADFQQLADVRAAEAGVLLAAGMWDGAYYLAGYAVECALKACILAYVERTGVIFEDKKFAEKCWTHKLDDLMGLAKLETALQSEAQRDPRFGANWDVAKRWTEKSRYARKTEVEARTLYDAITDATHGVLPWIKQHW